MALETLKHTVTDAAPTRAAGTLKLKERAQVTLQVESGTVRLVKAAGVYTDPGVVLAVGATFTEAYDPSELYLAVASGQTAVVQAHVSGAVSA